MTVLQHVLEHTEEEEMEKIRENMSQVFTTIGVVAALILTMEKTNEVIQDDDASHWIDCSEVPCNTIHVTLSWFSLIGCAHAVMYTTCAIVWLSVTPQEATRDFLYWTPSIMQRPSQSMMLGVVCWSFNALWLTIIKHGSSLMIWLAVPAFGLLFHVAWTFVRMRFFCWNWPKEPCGYYQTAWKMQGVKQPAGAEAAYQPINTGDALGGSGGPATR